MALGTRLGSLYKPNKLELTINFDPRAIFLYCGKEILFTSKEENVAERRC